MIQRVSAAGILIAAVKAAYDALSRELLKKM
jgi:hypothetical protein